MTSTFFRAGSHDLGAPTWPPLPTYPEMQQLYPSAASDDREWWGPGSLFEMYTRMAGDRFRDMGPRTRCLAAMVVWDMLAEIGIADFFDEFLPEYQQLSEGRGGRVPRTPTGSEIVVDVHDSLDECRSLPSHLVDWLGDLQNFTMIGDEELSLMVALYTISDVAMSRGHLQGQMPAGWQWSIRPEFSDGEPATVSSAFLFDAAARVYVAWIERTDPDGFAAPQRDERLNADARRFLGENVWPGYLAWIFLEDWRRRVMERVAVREGLAAPISG